MGRMFIFGLGYTGAHIANRLRGLGWTVDATGRAGTISFDDAPAVHDALHRASHILSTVPPDAGGADPVLARYGADITASGAGWVGYLSSTGVYGDTGGAWVDESAPLRGRRGGRIHADLHWQSLRPDVRVFRLPGIYGPGRSMIERVRGGQAHRIALPDQIFSRVHVDDIAGALIASFAGPTGVYNIADDLPCGQNRLVEAVCDRLNIPYPALQNVEDAGLSPAALAFYAENRRVANVRAKRMLDWRPLYPTWREGLAACLAEVQNLPRNVMP